MKKRVEIGRRDLVRDSGDTLRRDALALDILEDEVNAFYHKATGTDQYATFIKARDQARKDIERRTNAVFNPPWDDAFVESVKALGDNELLRALAQENA